MILNSDYYVTESVLRGHPDKICDQISDAILDEYLDVYKRQDIYLTELICGQGTTQSR